MRYTKEWTIEVREDIFNQLRKENDFLTQENIELSNKLELAIRITRKLAEENRQLDKKVAEQYYEIQQYEEWFANWSWHWEDEID